MTADDVHAAFATPLVVRRFPENGEFNRKLAQHILEWEERERDSIGRSNYGGWHSPDKIMQHDTPEIAQLRDMISEAIRDATLKFATEKPETADVWMMGWANVLRENSFNRLHNHHPSGWSSVYYVQVGESKLDDNLSGVIEFIDPRPGVNAAKLPGSPFDQKIRVAPEDGMLLLFPAWLKHIVYPYRGKTTRIAIAVNIVFEKDAEAWARRD